MKATYIFLILFIVMVGIAYMSGGKVAEHYGSQMIYAGHEIYVGSPTSGTIDGTPAKIVHMGDTNINSFNVYGVYQNRGIIVLDHSMQGIVGSTYQSGYMTNKQYYQAGESIDYQGIRLTYNGSINGIQIYEVNGEYIGIKQGINTIIKAGQEEYVLTEVSNSANPTIQIAKVMINQISIESIVLLIMLAIVIYSIGEAVGLRWS